MENDFIPKQKVSARKWILPTILIVAILFIVGIVFLVSYMKKNAPETPFIASDTQDEQIEKREIALRPPPRVSYPAKLFIDPPKTEISIGEEVTLKVMVETGDKNTVVAGAEVSWDDTALELKEIVKKGSVYPMQVLANEGHGTAEVVRGIPGDGDFNDSDDGYTGKGALTSLVLVAKKKGIARVTFNRENSEVILDDGQGSKMEMSFGEAEVIIR